MLVATRLMGEIAMTYLAAMNLNQVTLPSTDVARSVAFYRRLGFRQIVANLPTYARFECPVGTATFSFHHVTHMPAQSGVIVYFECDDLDRTVDRLRGAGIALDALPKDQPWLWREAYLRDPDGNTICLFHAGTNRRHPPWRIAADAEASGARAGADRAEPTISLEDDPSPSDAGTIAAGLSAHALPVTRTLGFKPIGAFARDERGAVVGGIVAMVNWNWLQITLVWVDERLRGTGLGHRLLGAIEDAGRRRGCTHAHLDTFSYQARPFYERHGYRLFGTLENYPPGERRFFMEKALGPAPRVG